MEEGARVRVVRCLDHLDCSFVGTEGVIVRVEPAYVPQRSAWVRFDGSRNTWYFAIANLEVCE